MKKNALVKQCSGTDAVKLDKATGVMMCSGQDATNNPKDGNSLTLVRGKSQSNMQPRDEFRYSGRCFCGPY